MRLKWTGKRFEWFQSTLDMWGTIAPPDSDRFASPGDVYLDIGMPGRCVRNLYVENVLQCDGTPYSFSSSSTEFSGLSLSGLTDTQATGWTSGTVVGWDGSLFVPTTPGSGGGGSTYYAGSGLYDFGTIFHVGAGTGITVFDNYIETDTAYFDGRYAASGNYATVSQGHELWAASGNYASSGNYATVEQGHELWAPSGNYQASGNYALESQIVPGELHKQYLPAGEALTVGATKKEQILVYDSYEIEDGAVLNLGPSGTLVTLTDQNLIVGTDVAPSGNYALVSQLPVISSGRYVTQFTATGSQAFNHALSGYPQVSVLNSTLQEIDVEVQHTDINNTTITFAGTITNGWFISDVSTTTMTAASGTVAAHTYAGSQHTDVVGTWISGDLTIFDGTNHVPLTSGFFVGRQELLQQYNLELDEAAGSITYIGEALPGTATSDPLWRIKRLDESDPIVELIITWADGNDSFDNIWDNRAALSYS